MLTISLGGTDISTRLLPTASVHKSERAAATASFTYSPSGTPALPDALINLDVVINWSGERLFTGKVNSAVWDPGARNYKIEASDMLQESFEGKDDAAIQALIPGCVYSESVFGARSDGWTYALDCLSTVAIDLYKDRFGDLQTTAWAAKATADKTFTGAQILNDGAYSLHMASKRELITRHTISYQYRVSRWKVRDHKFSWSAFNSLAAGVRCATSWCDWIVNHQYYMPKHDTIVSAAQGTGWAIRTGSAWAVGAPDDDNGVHFQGHPVNGIYYCGPSGSIQVIWDNMGGSVADDAISAGWTGQRHWGQTVTEEYRITLAVPSAQAALGMLDTEDGAAYGVEADDSAFESNPIPQSAATWNTDSLGDHYQDQEDEARRLLDLGCLINAGATRILGAWRGNSVSVETAIVTDAELFQTVAINTADIQAKGKVAEIQHNITGDRATTVWAIAISTGPGDAGDSITIPARPDTSPIHTPPAASTALGTAAGGCGDVIDFDEDWEGWTTFVPQVVNEVTYDGGGNPSQNTHTRPTCDAPAVEPTPEQLYPLRFKVTGPDIEAEARDEVTATQAVIYNLSVPADTLVLT